MALNPIQFGKDAIEFGKQYAEGASQRVQERARLGKFPLRFLCKPEGGRDPCGDGGNRILFLFHSALVLVFEER